MASSKIYWNRIGHVRIEGPDGKMYSYGGDTDSLDFKFRVQKLCGNIYVKFSVSILGLSASTINFLTTWNVARALRTPRRIEVYAGYESDGKAPLIIKGYIINAIPTTPPEMWLNIEGLNVVMAGKSEIVPEDSIVFSKTTTTAKDLFEKAAQVAGYKPVWTLDDAAGSRIVTVPRLRCDKSELIEQVKQILGVLIEIEGDCLVAHNTNGWVGMPQFASEVSMDTGMIEISHIDVRGAKIKIRLNDTFKLFSWIHLTSKLIPKATGYYFVVGKVLQGHLRGEDWFVELDTVRKDAARHG